MTVYDYWLNPLDPSVPSVTVLGFREDIEEFPHELYSFFSSSIRDMDLKNVRLMYRWLQGMQQEFESIYGKILNLPLLYSADFCPEDFLDYLAMNVGITSPDMDYLWGELTTIEKRRLIRTFADALRRRSTQDGIQTLIRSMTGQYAELREYFDFRWIVSGDGEYETESALGYEDDHTVAGDTWLISEPSMPIGYTPDDIQIIDYGTYILYLFEVTTLVNAISDPPVPPNPPNVRMTYRPTKSSTTGVVIPYGSQWYVVAPRDFKFEQTAIPYSDRLSDFRVGFENDAYVFDIRVMDDGSVNRDLISALARFSRPISERIYIRYFNLIDRFTDDDIIDNWTIESGGATLDTDENEVTLTDPTVESVIRSDVSNDDAWSEYSFGVRARISVANKTIYMRFAWQDANNYLELQFVPAAEPTIPVGTWALGAVVGGAPSPIASGDLIQFDLDVNYFFRVVWIHSLGNLVMRVYQDENLLNETTVTSPWTDPKGKVEIGAEAGSTVVVSDVEVHPYPMDEQYVGP